MANSEAGASESASPADRLVSRRHAVVGMGVATAVAVTPAVGRRAAAQDATPVALDAPDPTWWQVWLNYEPFANYRSMQNSVNDELSRIHEAGGFVRDVQLDLRDVAGELHWVAQIRSASSATG